METQSHSTRVLAAVVWMPRLKPEPQSAVVAMATEQAGSAAVVWLGSGVVLGPGAVVAVFGRRRRRRRRKR